MMQVTKVWWDGEKLMAEPIDPTTIYQEPAQEKDWGAVGDAHIAAIKKSTKAMVEDAVVRAAHKVMAEFEAKLDERFMEPPPDFIDALKYDVARRDSEFFTHCVDQPYDWSEWVCPDPKGYLMKCCDCGLVHEAEFGVVRYKSETEREDCDMVDDPNLQAVFRMRRSEQWSPADTAHRAGGLTMEQPAQQEPVAYMVKAHGMLQRLSRRADVADELACQYRKDDPNAEVLPLYTSPPAQRTWVGLTDEEIKLVMDGCGEEGDDDYVKPAFDPFGISEDDLMNFARAIEAKLKEKNNG